MVKKFVDGMCLGVIIGFVFSAVASAPARAETGSVAGGKKKYQQAGCDGCHGERGRGDGPAAMALTPKPPDFCTSTKHPTDEKKFAMIAQGGASMSHSPGMPPYKSTLDKQAILDIVAYIQSVCKK